MDLNMLNKTIALVLVFFMSFPAYAMADETEETPKIHNIKKDERAPYDGVLLNPQAAAEVFANKSYFQQECELKIKFQVDKEKAKLQLLLDSQKVSYDSLEKKYIAIINIKDQEIDKLSSIALGKKDYSSFWTVGGMLAGIGLTLAVLYAVER
mgnify:CR=1 FL=1